MNHDPSKKQKLPVSEESEPVMVPTFACIVYVSSCPAGVQARVANLPGMECQAATEREALGQLVPMFKDRVGRLTREQALIPWIDPPLPIKAEEQKRFIPVHL